MAEQWLQLASNQVLAPYLLFSSLRAVWQHNVADLSTDLLNIKASIGFSINTEEETTHQLKLMLRQMHQRDSSWYLAALEQARALGTSGGMLQAADCQLLRACRQVHSSQGGAALSCGLMSMQALLRIWIR